MTKKLSVCNPICALVRCPLIIYGLKKKCLINILVALFQAVPINEELELQKGYTTVYNHYYTTLK